MAVVDAGAVSDAVDIEPDVWIVFVTTIVLHYICPAARRYGC